MNKNLQSVLEDPRIKPTLHKISKKHAILLLALSVLIGLVGNWLFYDSASGVSVVLFLFVVYGVFFLLHKDHIDKRNWFAWFLTGIVFLQSLTFMLFTNKVFAGINVLLIPGLFVASTILFTGNNKKEWFDIRFVSELFPRFTGKVLGNSFKPFYALSYLQPDAMSGRWIVFRQILWGMILSIPLLAVVLYLLASADSVFQSLLGNIPEWLDSFSTTVFTVQFFNVSVLTIFFGSLFWSLLHKEKDLQKDPVGEVKRNAQAVTSATILVLLNLIYALFIGIQFGYLFGGGDLSFLEGFTYAEYARRGFAEIVLVSIINLSVTLSVLHSTIFTEKMKTRVVKVLLSLLIILSACLLFSASFRLSIYEEVYGYTYRRFFARTLMIMLGVFFAGTLVKVWVEKISVMKVYIVTALSLFTLLTYIDIDTRIVEKNLARYEQTGDIDLLYLSKISHDSFVGVIPLMNAEDEEIAKFTESLLYEKKEQLSQDIYKKWQAYNISRKTFFEAVNSLDL